MQNIHDSHIKSICGVPLKGNRLVRLTFIDESGTSHREPIITVAAVIIDGNKQLNDVEIALQNLVQKFIPIDQQEEFYFHSSDIFSGNKQYRLFGRCSG